VLALARTVVCAPVIVTVPVPTDPLNPEVPFQKPSYVAVMVVGFPAPAVLAEQLVELVEPEAVSVPVQRVTGNPAEVVVNVTMPVGAVVPVVGLTDAE
jgi:hypothetical protein